MEDPHKDRWRGTLEEARAHAEKPKGLLSVSHVLDNGDGTYSVMSHINCEWCDYCSAERGIKTTVHQYKPNPYENQEKFEDDGEQARDTTGA